MSYSGIGAELFGAAPKPAPTPYGYLAGGPGTSDMWRIGRDTAAALISGETKTIAVPGAISPVYVPTDQVVSAVWAGHDESARMFADMMVTTIQQEQLAKPPGQRLTFVMAATQLVGRIRDAMSNKGDPSSCILTFENSMTAWKSIYAGLPASTSTGWCARLLVFSGKPGEVAATCLKYLDSKGVVQTLLTSPPPAGALTAPPGDAATGAPVPPPSHAQIDAAIQQKMAASGETFEQLEKDQEESELATYMSALSESRVWLTYSLGLPTTASDAAIYSALQQRGISKGEALDWFTGCGARLDCFRERMNAALGRTDEEAIENKTKTSILIGAAIVSAAAFVVWRAR